MSWQRVIGAFAPPPAIMLLGFLLVGHVMADFLFQSRQTVEAKEDGGGYARHAVAVLVVQLVFVAPVLSGSVVLLVGAVTILHVLIDWLKSRWAVRRMGRLAAFLADQSAHVGVIWGGWLVLRGVGGTPVVRFMSLRAAQATLAAAILGAAFAFNATGGSAVVEALFDVLRRRNEEGGVYGAGGYEGAGRLIGILERTLMLIFLLAGQWSGTVLLVAAKSIARFEEIKKREFAEYYLVGTLASLLMATLVGVVLTECLFGAH